MIADFAKQRDNHAWQIQRPKRALSSRLLGHGKLLRDNHAYQMWTALPRAQLAANGKPNIYDPMGVHADTCVSSTDIVYSDTSRH
jgi:hypothetical protein